MVISRREFLGVSSAAVGGLLTGCAATGEAPRPFPGSPRPASGAADLLLRNGTVLTVDANDRVAQAVAISKGIIQKVGTDEEVVAFRGPATEVVDLHGRAVTPGLIDAHNHMM